MGDLTVALVDLARSAEQRRDARRSLRQSVSTIVTELLKHLRVGDWIKIPLYDADGFEHPVTYVVERVTWPIEGPGSRLGSDGTVESIPTDHPKGAATLVRYDDGNRNPDGAVLLDVRTPGRSASGEAAVVGRTITSMTDPSGSLRFATDDELLYFAREAEWVVKGFAERCRDTAAQMAEVADTITKLTPR